MSNPAIVEQNDNASSLSNLLNRLFSLLNERNVSYCVLRNYRQIPESIGNDLDLLVGPEDTRKLHNCLTEACVRSDWRILKNPRRYGFRSYWLLSGQGRQVVHIDVWTRQHWKGICLADNKFFLKERKRFRNFFVPSCCAEAGTLLIKDLLQNGRVKRKYAREIQQFAESDGELLCEFLKDSLGRKLAGFLTEKARIAQWQEIDARAFSVRMGLVIRAFLKNPLSPGFSFLCFLWGHLCSRLGKRNGMFVALIGPDGSGKTTVTEQLVGSLDRHFDICRPCHGHFGLLPELKIFRNMFRQSGGLRNTTASSSRNPSTDHTKAHGLGRVLVYVIYYGLDYFLGHWIVRGFQARGDLLIFDRYFYDIFLQYGYRKTPRCFWPIFKRILPRPDLVVYLYNDPAVIHQRKPELTVEQITEQAAKCSRLVENLPYAVTCRTDRSVERVVDDISDGIEEIMLNRFQGVSE